LEPLSSFILPGGSPGAALLHLARTIVRRAERSTWTAFTEHKIVMTETPARYLNRLSDLLFVLARYSNREQGDVLWVPGANR
jgi:cob(I)alamin adenosyltransferase